MEEQLGKIRLQSKSGLENQRKASFLLNAVEETIREQQEPLVPISYFGTLVFIQLMNRCLLLKTLPKMMIQL